MSQKNLEDITFQATGTVPLIGQYTRAHFSFVVARLTISSRLPKQDIRVTIGVGDVSKITCSGELSEDGLAVTWNHPFLL